jgi:hypothetical protein
MLGFERGNDLALEEFLRAAAGPGDIHVLLSQCGGSKSQGSRQQQITKSIHDPSEFFI